MTRSRALFVHTGLMVLTLLSLAHCGKGDGNGVGAVAAQPASILGYWSDADPSQTSPHYWAFGEKQVIHNSEYDRASSLLNPKIADYEKNETTILMSWTGKAKKRVHKTYQIVRLTPSELELTSGTTTVLLTRMSPDAATEVFGDEFAKTPDLLIGQYVKPPITAP